MFFENIHHDTINSVERLSTTVFATASDDGTVNVRILITNIVDLGHQDGIFTKTYQLRR